MVMQGVQVDPEFRERQNANVHNQHLLPRRLRQILQPNSMNCCCAHAHPPPPELENRPMQTLYGVTVSTSAFPIEGKRHPDQGGPRQGHTNQWRQEPRISKSLQDGGEETGLESQTLLVVRCPCLMSQSWPSCHENRRWRTCPLGNHRSAAFPGVAQKRSSRIAWSGSKHTR